MYECRIDGKMDGDLYVVLPRFKLMVLEKLHYYTREIS